MLGKHKLFSGMHRPSESPGTKHSALSPCAHSALMRLEVPGGFGVRAFPSPRNVMGDPSYISMKMKVLCFVHFYPITFQYEYKHHRSYDENGKEIQGEIQIGRNIQIMCRDILFDWGRYGGAQI